MEDALGGKTTYAYDAAGDLVSITDANGHTTQRQYDLLGRVIEAVDPLGNREQFGYDLSGNLTQYVNALGQVTRNDYGPRGELAATHYADGSQVGWQYDALGRLTGMSSPAADEQYTLDPLGRVLKVATAIQASTPVMKSLSFTYDAAGNRSSLTDTDGRTVQYQYDAANRLTGLTDPDGQHTGYTFNNAGQPASILYPNQGSVSYTYDDATRVAAVTNRGVQGILSSFSYGYDEGGNVNRVTENDGATSTFRYDALDRLAQATYPKDKIQAIRDEYYTPSKAYSPTDSAQAGTDTTGTDSGSTDTSGTSGQPGGTPKQRSNGGSKQFSAMASLSTSLAQGPVAFSLEVSREIATRLVASAGSNNGKGNGGNSNGGGGTNGGNKGKSGDPHGKGPAQGGPQEASATDPGYRTYLETPDYFLDPQAQVNYTYDAAGNRLSMTGDQGTTDYTYDAANRMLSAGSNTYAYDDAGNLTRKTDETGTVQYEYSPTGKLSRVAYDDGTDVRYTYDGLGRNVDRVETYWQEPGPSENGLAHGKGFTQGQRKGIDNAKSNGKGQGQNALKLRDEETTYLYDGLQVFQEFTGEGSPLGEYMRGNDLVASRQTFGLHGRKDEGREGNLRTRGGLLYYGYDGLGSVTDLTDHTGDEAMQSRYDAFGGIFTGITSPYNTVGFTGKSYDPKAGLLQFYSRWYDPSVGRFTTQDSYLGELIAPASQHRYAYVLNNPVTKVDRWGYYVPPDPGGDPDPTPTTYYAYANERTVTTTDSWQTDEWIYYKETSTTYADKCLVTVTLDGETSKFVGTVITNQTTKQWRDPVPGNPGNDPGDPGSDPGTDPGYPGTDPGNDPGNPGDDPGKNPGDDPGTQPPSGGGLTKAEEAAIKEYQLQSRAGLIDPDELVPLTDLTREGAVSNLTDLMEQNAIEAQQHWPNAFWFRSQVSDRAPWDYKVKLPYKDRLFGYRGRIISGEDLGNINFGYTGTAFGFPAEMLKLGAGLHAKLNGEPSGGISSNFDQPRDQEMINWGIELYEEKHPAPWEGWDR